MYEDRTFENILQDMLNDVPADIDKREGSIIYDALAPTAKKLALAYMELELNSKLSHAQTSSGEELRMRGADFGVDEQLATPAIRKGLFSGAENIPFDVPTGSRYAAGGLNFEVKEKIDTGVFKLECETAGANGNVPFGKLLPLDYVNGLVSAEITEILIPGEDDETDEQYRARFYAQVRTPPTSGNRAAYRKWALEVNGVGDAYVEPIWNGPNTVKIYLLGNDRTPAPAGVVQAVKDYIDPKTGLGEGMGEGMAPAGSVTTVVAAHPVPINVAAQIVLDGSRTLQQVEDDFKTAIVAHLADIANKAFASLHEGDRGVRFARIGTLLLDTPGVADYNAASLTINGGQSNINVPAGSVAVVGTVTLDE